MSHYGFEIVQTLIVDIEPDEHVKRAMNEINAGIALKAISLYPANTFFLLIKFLTMNVIIKKLYNSAVRYLLIHMEPFFQFFKLLGFPLGRCF